ncbi:MULTISPECIES: hypothetical protein [unclassified Mesorhizobium]|uniref:hypothetical protein n=1 Tax=unclassified Mesorhizobium TaxID=325217 RepID=UPI000FDAF185|nr:MULTISPECIES: hypothetical protein [unclassified Mesorhizobium]TGQ08954.1 hypothetical protein EN862_022235 [Mesorhizobium sp. M2E.F.Ca.ET.219.01.1.1]TGT69489.1 hypothetical protein EN809_024515 [Mesorhizobium sp. M2E.F.Ca.ET.166.01.1.1]TGW01821.1 hypothetical protein EN797_016010 [Mesorhizobium sp. M2E.F.Ca.ET.154.01.1.1]
MALSREGVAMGRTRNRRTTMQAPAPVVDANAANASSGYFLAGGMGLIGILIPWYFEFPLNFDVTDREFNPLIFIPVVFLVIAFYALLKAIRDTLRVRKFGTTTLIAGTAVPGGRFEGAVRSSRDLTPNGDYTVQLKCIRTYRVGGPVVNTSGTQKSTYKDELKWRETIVVPSTSVRSSAGIPFAFQIPPDALPSRGPPIYERVHGNVRWILTVSAPMRGLNYYAVFAIEMGGPSHGQ